MDPRSAPMASKAQVLSLLFVVTLLQSIAWLTRVHRLPQSSFSSWEKSKYLLQRKYLWSRMTLRQYFVLRNSCMKCMPEIYPRNFDTVWSFAWDKRGVPPPTAPCPICSLIGSIFHRFMEGDPCTMSYSCTISFTGDMDLCFPEYSLANDGNETCFQIHIPDLQYPQHPLGLSREVSRDPLDIDPVMKMKRWIDQCAREHSRCVENLPQAIMPTRLIDLDEKSTTHARLIELDDDYIHSSTSVIRYAALSYCWGTSKQNGTTRDNLSSRLEDGLDIHTLPRTLQDALLIVKALDLRYIWIDSWCIVQDDSDDWARESANMADIYKGAWVVLAATSASDCALGFLQQREGTQVIASGGENGIRANVRRTTTHTHGFSKNRLPLFERAWALQEMELARRIIYFLPDEIVWRCAQKTECECGDRRALGARFSDTAVLFKESLSSIEDPANNFAHYWNKLVESYLDLKLTRQADLLPALSGIAKHIQDMNTGAGKYIVGVWEQDIAFQLPWCYDFSRPTLETKSEERSPSPTFSWTAASGPITWPSHPILAARCTLIGSTTTPTTPNPYGPARDCSITLRGSVLQGPKLIQCIDRLQPSQQDSLSLDDIGDSDQHPWGFELIGLQLYDIIVSTGLASVVLILRRRAHETHFTRRGVLERGDPKWFEEEGQERTIIIR